MKKIFLLLLLTLTGNAAFAQTWPAESLTFTTRQPNGGGTMVRVVNSTTALGLYHDNGNHFALMQLNATIRTSVQVPTVLEKVTDYRIDQGVVYFCGQMDATKSYVAKFNLSDLDSAGDTLTFEYITFGVPNLIRLVAYNGNRVYALSHEDIIEIQNFDYNQCSLFTASSVNEVFGDIVLTDNYVVVVSTGANGFVVRRGLKNQASALSEIATNGNVFSNPNDTYLDPASYSHAVALAGDNIAISHLAASNRSVPPLGVDAQTRLHWVSLENNNVEVRSSQFLQDPLKCEAREMVYIPETQTVAMLRPTNLEAWNYYCDIVFFNPYRGTAYNTPYIFNATGNFGGIDADGQNTLIVARTENGQAQWMLKDASQSMGGTCYTASQYVVKTLLEPSADQADSDRATSCSGNTNPPESSTVQTLSLTQVCRNP